MINGLSVKFFILAFLIFIITDIMWFGLIAKNLYFQHYEPLLRVADGKVKIIWWAALIIYLLFALSVVTLIVPLAQGSLSGAAFYGAILGFVIYGIYNFTCIALFKDYPIGMAFLDWTWGTILCSWGSFFTIYLGTYMNGLK